ncbi:MAG: hypothetical protein NZ750_11335 [Anaerolineae bacterium]|nr:hypothetical protein [Anaerolineae bacterium]MDW8172081.1 hypothetical protein [Anaerolineae bacterium]
MGRDAGLHDPLAEQRRDLPPEAFQVGQLLALACRDVVECRLHLRREVHVEQVGQLAQQHAQNLLDQWRCLELAFDST